MGVWARQTQAASAPSTGRSEREPSDCERTLGRVCTVPRVIDFDKAAVFKLAKCDPSEVADSVAPLAVPGEELVATYKGARDHVVFTNKRMIAVNVQGLTGKKRDFTSLPYSKIQAFSVETAGHFDLDAELEIWFSGLGKVRLEFRGKTDIQEIGQMIARYVL